VPSEPFQATPSDAEKVTGVKGSPVQIRPSRRIFRTPVPQTGNEISHDRSQLPPATRAKHPWWRLHSPKDRVAAAAEIPGPAGRIGDLPTRQTQVDLDQHAIVEQLDQRRAARAPRYPFGAEYTDPGHPTWKSRWTSPG
jgi:hypothetical protein